MKNILKIGLLAFSICVGTTGCDFFEKIPGVQLDMNDTFTNRKKTEQYLSNVYTYAPDDATGERYYKNTSDRYGGIWTSGSLELNVNWDWHDSHKWNLNQTTASSEYITFWWNHYYQGINKASTFIQNVDMNPDITEAEKILWKAEARALRALYYFYLFRTYGPVVLMGEEPTPTEISSDELLKPRSTVDECVKWIVDELDLASEDLPARAPAAQYGRIDRGSCKAFKAKILLYAASPLFNGNTMYATVVNPDGTNLFPQSEDPAKWQKAVDAYEEFFEEFVPVYFDLHRVNTNGVYDPYESYRQITSGYYIESKENIFMKLVDHGDLNYAVTPTHKHISNGEIQGGLGFSASQEIVDMYFTQNGLRIEEDEEYLINEYGVGVVPDAKYYGSSQPHADKAVPSRNYFKANSNLTLKQWEKREPRFYVCITYNGSTWLNTGTTAGEVTTELYRNGNSGFTKSAHDAPFTGYGMRKTARASTEQGKSKHVSILLRLADMYLGYAEALCETGALGDAIDNLNKIRNRAGIPEYGEGTDSNGFTRLSYPNSKDEVMNRIRRERLIELSYEASRFFDVRRWKVADMTRGDGWIYPTYHNGGEGGVMHGLDYTADAPGFFKKVEFQNRIFEPRHYFMPIPNEEVLRNPHMVQNYDWKAEVTED